MSNEGVWTESQVQQKAAEIAAVAATGGNVMDEVRQADKRFVGTDAQRAQTAQAFVKELEKNGTLPAFLHDQAAAYKKDGAKFAGSSCHGATPNFSIWDMSVNKKLTESPVGSIERTLFDKAARDRTFNPENKIRPAVPKVSVEAVPVVAVATPAKEINNYDKIGEPRKDVGAPNKPGRDKAVKPAETETERALKAVLLQLKEMRDENAAFKKEIADLKAGKTPAKPADVPAAKQADVPAAKPVDVPAGKQADVLAAKPVDVPAAKKADVPAEKPEVAAETAARRAHLEQLIANIDLQVATATYTPEATWLGSIKDKPIELKRSVTVNIDDKGGMLISGEPYGTIALDSKTKFSMEKDNSIIATDSTGKTYQFFGTPILDAEAGTQGLVLKVTDTDKAQTVIKKFVPNEERLVSETITKSADGGKISQKEFVKREKPYLEHFQGTNLTPPLAQHRADWITATRAEWDAKGGLRKEVVDYGKSGYLEEDTTNVRKRQETFYYGEAVVKGVTGEHVYDNGFKYTVLNDGKTYVQRRVVSESANPLKFKEQSEKNPTMKNGTVQYRGEAWAMSNRQLRDGVNIERTQRNLPESYVTWFTEGELNP